VRKAKKNLPWLFTRESRRWTDAQLRAASIETWVALAYDGDKDAIDILQAYTQGAREAGINVPRAVEEYALDCLAFGPPKTKSGPNPKDTAKTYLTIAMLVDMVSREYGFPEYRNIEHRGETDGAMSACLLVAEELGLSERTVEKIWAERKEMICRRHSPY
jgi:hypothetical protein